MLCSLRPSLRREASIVAPTSSVSFLRRERTPHAPARLRLNAAGALPTSGISLECMWKKAPRRWANKEQEPPLAVENENWELNPALTAAARRDYLSHVLRGGFFGG